MFSDAKKMLYWYSGKTIIFLPQEYFFTDKNFCLVVRKKIFRQGRNCHYIKLFLALEIISVGELIVA